MKNFSRRDFIKLSALTFLAPSFFCRNVNAAGSDCQVKTRYGIFDGFVDKNGVKTWLGIPYAKPPVGNLRWHAPEKLEPSNKIFSAKKFGASPLQEIDPVEPASEYKQSEDCLTLNIWRHSDKKNLPVMVFIPGGGFVGGGTADDSYNGAKLASAGDVIVVTLNYRLNIFGFMNFAGVDPTFEDAGYLGIKDQLAALEWVHENIENFGGNPDNVTVFGESAGSVSTMLLTILPATKNLFHKAIAQSGSPAFYHEPQPSAKFAAEFMEFGNYKDMAQMMKTSPKKLLKTYEEFAEKKGFTANIDYFPTCDGKFLPEHPFQALKEGAARGKKLLTGNTQDEYLYWSFYYDGFVEILPEAHGRLTPVMYEGEFTTREELYDSWQKNHMDIDEPKRYLEFANQLDWRVGQELCAEYQSAYDDVYLYLFSQKSQDEELGSCHAIDLPFVFDHAEEDIEPNPPRNLIKQVQATWIAFATSGNPNNPEIPQWKRYTVDHRETMNINSSAWSCIKDLNTENVTALRHVYEDNLLD